MLLYIIVNFKRNKDKEKRNFCAFRRKIFQILQNYTNIE